MWAEFLIVGSAPCALVAGAWLGWRANDRLMDRLAGRRATLEAIRDLENRRVATESGRDQLVRARAGRSARVSDGMVTRTGTLERWHRESRLTKKNDDERG